MKSLANKLTILRMILSPFFFGTYALLGVFENSRIARIVIVAVLWFIFIAIELSDLFDGRVARARGEVSDFGKVLDPFADSVSRLTYFICFTWEGIMPFWILLILVYRDLFTSFIRMYASTKGIVHGSKMSGKIKAWVYAAAGISGLLLISVKKLLIFPEAYTILSSVNQIIFLSCVLIAFCTVADYSSGFLKKKK
jgi:CDP-diacylglycerol--glycerol-3-phosphate 3-phosphatidyltransferase